MHDHAIINTIQNIQPMEGLGEGVVGELVQLSSTMLSVVIVLLKGVVSLIEFIASPSVTSRIHCSFEGTLFKEPDEPLNNFGSVRDVHCSST